MWGPSERLHICQPRLGTDPHPPRQRYGENRKSTTLNSNPKHFQPNSRPWNMKAINRLKETGRQTNGETDGRTEREKC